MVYLLVAGLVEGDLGGWISGSCGGGSFLIASSSFLAVSMRGFRSGLFWGVDIFSLLLLLLWV